MQTITDPKIKAEWKALCELLAVTKSQEVLTMIQKRLNELAIK